MPCVCQVSILEFLFIHLFACYCFSGIYFWKPGLPPEDVGGKFVSEKSKSTGGKPGATRTSNNPFETSRREKHEMNEF